MATRLNIRTLVLGAALALLALGSFAFAPTTLPRTLAQTAPTPAPNLRSQLPIGVVDAFLPLLTTLEGAGMVAPGGLVTVDGSNLGDRAGGTLCLRWGQVVINQVVVNNGFSSNHQTCLSIDDWQPTRIRAEVPSGLVGVPDQTAHLVATRGDGVQSSALEIKFVATRTVVVASNAPGQGNPLTIDCSTAASTVNECNPIGGFHANSIFCCSIADYAGADGRDVYHLQLSHGWTYVQETSLGRTGGDGDVTLAGQPVAGATSGDVTVHWSAGGFGGSVQYLINIRVIGPVGVPLD